MNTPIYDFVQNYINSDAARFHMPGHKGRAFLGCEERDITEIGGADVLYAPDGIIAESENNATSLFGSAHTFYSAEGSSLAIRAMLALAKSTSDKAQPLILAARNAHKAFIYTCALLDLRVEWLCPETPNHVCGCDIPPHALQKRLSEMAEKPDAVFITSPDYLGDLADIGGLADVCNKHGIPLLVDNAHGAYLRFLPGSLHPMDLGATACCDSAHKTLPVLTGGAYLHVAKKAPREYTENARKYLSLFASTSPSYLILQSLDLCNAYLDKHYRARLVACIHKAQSARAHAEKIGFSTLDTEPLKIVFNAKKSGYHGDELADLLKSHGIECEMSDPDYLVLMVTPETRDSDFDRLAQALEAIGTRAPIESHALSVIPPNAILTPRQAILAPSETVPRCEAVGRICAAPTVACPPAVPIVMSGERITHAHTELMAYYGHSSIEVIK
ncbi:MAG: amino acid decarboxylase [Clostridia bacterium]|nr:amino acid decarboxylase [Clostridia bacterium]